MTIGTYSWFEDGYGKTITATFTELSGLASPVPGASVTTHTSGDTGNTVSYSSAINMTLYASYQSPGSGYNTYLNNAIINAGLKTSTTAAEAAGTRVYTIPSSYASGRYCVGVIYDIAEGSWKITNGAIQNGSEPSVEPYALDRTSGTISYVPTGDYIISIVPAA